MSVFLASVKKILVAVFPKTFTDTLFSAYHFFLALMGAAVYGFPARQITTIAVTGTKGKSSTLEMMNAILEEAGHVTALSSSVRIKIGSHSEANLLRMTMPGRFFIQKFLRDAVRAKCTVALVEMTSEGARQHRHRFTNLDALIFTNLAPEHIESHGSYKAYADTKFKIGRELARSPKRPRIIVANWDDKEGERYLALSVEKSLPFSLHEHTPWEASEHGGHFRFDNADIRIHLPGEFSLKNALAAATLARALNIPSATIGRALSTLKTIPGRAERIEEGQDFTVVVDYAHTPDSLRALYSAYDTHKRICVLGATGGGRDRWKRPVMGSIADSLCEHVILTNEDPYDENPLSIVEEVARGMKRKPHIIMDRREAMRHAFSIARGGDAVLITGKGTDPCICVENGKQIPWSDAAVAREELRALGKKL